MATESRMTIRLDPATRRKVERLAAREGISLNEAVGRLLREAPEGGNGRTPKRRRYRLKPRKVGFAFDITRSRRLARKTIDDAHLAALAISRGATLASFDDDFAAFSEGGLRREQLSS